MHMGLSNCNFCHPAYSKARPSVSIVSLPTAVIVIVVVLTMTTLATPTITVFSFPLLSLTFVSSSTFLFLFGPSLILGRPSISLGVVFERSNERQGYGLDVQEIAKAAALTIVFVEISTSGFAKVRDGRKFGLNGAAVVEAAVHDLERVTGFFLVPKAGVHVSNHVVPHIIGNVQAF